MNTKIVERPPLIVVGLQIDTKAQSPEIPALWPRFLSRIDEIAHLAEPNVSYGVMWHAGKPQQLLHYLASLSVTGASLVPAGMVSRDVPAGTYASFTYPFAELGTGWGEIFQSLLPKSGYAQVPGPYFERYDEAFDPGDGNSLVEICLPVKRKI